MSEIKIENIPPMGDIILQVLSFDIGGNTSGSVELLNIISRDKGIVSSVLKASNAPYLGRAGKVKDLQEAITVLGLKTVRLLILAAASKDFSKVFGDKPLLQKYFQHYPLLLAFVAIDLLEPLHLSTFSREEIFIMSMFAPIGMIVLAMNFTAKYETLIEKFEDLDNEQTLTLLEGELFSVNNHDIRQIVFNKWNFPKEHFVKIIEVQSEVSKATDKQYILTVASHVARILLDIPVMESEVIIVKDLLESKNHKYELLDKFDDEYLAKIKEMPLFT